MLTDTGIRFLCLEDYPGIPEIVEDGNSFFENALKKAKAISEYTGEIALADDSGLEVDFLNGQPGVHSSRFSGSIASDQTNIDKLLMELKDLPFPQRSAAFRCVLVLYHPDGQYKSFQGSLDGFITYDRQGDKGFGYDPVFFVSSYNMTFAEMPLDLKNKISHRGKALKALRDYLKRYSIC
jgi:XTP/dITP diphosphohydrolase